MTSSARATVALDSSDGGLSLFVDAGVGAGANVVGTEVTNAIEGKGTSAGVEQKIWSREQVITFVEQFHK